MKNNILRNLFILMGLVCISISLFSLPSAANDFGEVTATCADGTQIQCDGYSCTVTQGVGCTCRDEHNVIVDQKKCPKIVKPHEDR